MNRWTLTAAISALALAVTQVVYTNATHLAADGTLVEPFYLVPLGYLLLVLTLVAGSLGWRTHRRQHRAAVLTAG